MKVLSCFVRTLLSASALLGIASGATILNSSFEQPVTSGFVYDPIDPTGGWTFSGRSGVAANTFFSPPPPNGSQAGFIQQFVDQPTALSSISQSVTGVSLVPSILTFFIAQRPGFAADPIVVAYGSQNLGTFTPASTSFATVTINFTPTATSGTLTFHSAATTTGDLDTAIDSVAFNSVGTVVPEPSSTLLVLSALGLLALVRRRSN
jgi:hypothetical protein